MKEINVFVYGTLLCGQSNHRVVAPYVTGIKPGRIKGRLIDVGSFPAAILDDNGYDIHGEWFTIREEGLQHLDLLEGYRGEGKINLYDRKVIDDHELMITGYVYVWERGRGMPEIPCGSWREHREGLSTEMSRS